MRILAIIVFAFFTTFSFAQQLEIGTAINNHEIQFSSKQFRAVKIAFVRSFSDGRKLDSAYIDQIGNTSYLVLLGSKTGVKSKSAVSILLMNNSIYLTPQTLMKTCSNGACNDCEFFFENNRVVACKCLADGAVSNNCTYKVNDGAFFYSLVTKILSEK